MEKKNFISRLEIACSSDALRPVMNHIIFEDGCAICTDAHILVKQHLSLHGFTDEEIQQMEGKAIHKNKFKEIVKSKTCFVKDGRFQCETNNGVEIFYEFDKMDGLYPNWKAVVPQMKDGKQVEEIGFSTTILAKLDKLVAHDPDYMERSIRVKFFGENKAILVRSTLNDWDKETILLMPVMLR